MKDVIGQLETLRRRSSIALIAQRLAVVAAWTIGALILLVLLDYFIRLPAAFRFVLELAGFGVLGYFLATYVRTAFRFSPSLTQLALRVEHSLPSVQGRLASSVEFAAGGIDRSNELAARSVRETRTRLAGESVGSVLALERTWRDLGALIGVLAIALVFVMVEPAAARTGIARALLPYSDAKWPARTGVMSLMDQVVPPSRVHPQGQTLALRATVTKGPIDQRVYASYRLQREGRFEAWNEIVLTHQDQGVHERLIDTSADAVELYFRTADDRSDTEEILLVPPPSVLRASLTVTAPPYVSSRIAPLQQEMGPGIDERSVTATASLIGSNVRLALELNKALPVPARRGDAWLHRTLGWGEGPLPDFAVDPADPGRWLLRWRLERTTTLDLSLADEHGLRNGEPISYRIEAIEDRLPTVTMIRPETDEPVLAHAVVPLVGEAQDDVSVARIGLRAGVLRGGARPEGDTPSPVDWEEMRHADAATASVTAELDLGSFELVEGDVVLVRGVAEDIFELDGERHDPVLSPARRLRVISELDFASQVRRQLGAVRQNAIRIEAVQAELQDDVIDQGVQIGMKRAQAQVSERIGDQREALDELERLVRTNRLDDEQLADLLKQSQDLLDFAGRAASSAVEAMEGRQTQRGPSKPGEPGQRGGKAPGSDRPRDPPADEPAAAPDDGAAPDAGAEGEQERPEEIPELREPDEADRPIVEAQQEVRDELADLIELLDRDEDTWVVTRQLENLLEDQEKLQAQTTQANEQTMGRTRDELTEQEKSDLDRIEERQLDLAEKARQVSKSLRDRAEAMEEIDPESAAGMRSAANTADQRELDRNMENAAERVNRNQLQNATASQQQAQETIERMLEDIEESKQARTEQLLRRLASLIESIERLVTIQENEIAALAAARADEDFTGRDRSMIRLTQNTQSVAGEARGMGQEARRIARTLDRAADAQGAAVAALRAEPLDDEEADAAENRSLELLKEAKTLAEALQEETQDEQVRKRREELIEAYRQFVERQVTIRADVLKLSGHEVLDRRQLVEARRLATAQDQLANAIDDLRRGNQEVMNAAVFSLVHDRIDEWSGVAAETLREGDVGIEVTDRQQMIANAIGRLIEAMEETMAPPPEFAQDEQQQGGGGQGGEQPLIPPVAELKLLQGVQEEIYNQTTGIDGRTDLQDAQRRLRLRDLGEQQRELLELGEKMLEKLQPEGEREANETPETPDEN